MTIKQLIYFLKIAETGNLTKAAQLLNVSQPPLSYQLKLLEDELDIQLFVRDVRSMRITEAGLLLQKRGKKILADIDEMMLEIKNMSKKDSITLNIGAVSSVNHKIIPDIVKKIEEMFPDIMLNIYDGTSSRVQELLEKETIEIGIIREPFNHSQYERKRVVVVDTPEEEGEYLVACGKNELFKNHHPDEIKLKELVKSSLIVHRRFEDIILDNCNEKNLKPHIISRNDSIITSIEWAKHGLGIAIMPLSSSLLIDDKSIKIKKIIEPVSYSNLYVIWNKGKELSEAAKRIIEML